MTYIDVVWHHNNPTDPIRLVSELDESGWERRKLEFWENGSVGFASAEEASSDTFLGLVPCPSIEEINEDPQFFAKSIDAVAFEALWLSHVGPRTSATRLT